MNPSLEGRVALVTGAGRGIGRAIACELAARGARVMGVSRTERELADLAREADLEVLVAAVDDRDECARIVEETRSRLGPIEILVNNAGVGSAREQVIWEQDPAVWHASMAVNLHGPFELTRLAVPDMIGQRWGRIVMISSTAGEVGGPAMSAYCASKHGLLGLMRSVAQDVAPFNITCNAVCPGWVRTAMAEEKAESEARSRQISVTDIWTERQASNAADRLLRPEEIAATVAFLASEEASGINGEAVTVALGSFW